MHDRGRWRLAVWVVSALAAAGAARAERVALSVSPPLVEMVVAQGGDRSFDVTLTNDGDKAFRTQGQVADMKLDAEGGVLVMSAGSGPWSLSPWVGLDGRQMELRPGEQRTLRCRIRVPRGQRGGRYGVVLFSVQREAELGGSGMRLETRTGTVLLVTVARTDRKSGEVEEILVKPGEGGEVLLEAMLRNTGNVHFRASAEVLIRAADNRVIDRAKLSGGTGTVLPDGVRLFRGRWRPRRAQPGEYRAEVRFTGKGLAAVTGTAEFVLPLAFSGQAGANGDSGTARAGEPAS